MPIFYKKNKQRKKSEKYYQEALEAYRQLAKEDPPVYLLDVARTLNNLGGFSLCKPPAIRGSRDALQRSFDDTETVSKTKPARLST